MKIKFIIYLIIFFLSFNINAAISQSGITGLKQLDNNGIFQLINGKQLSGYISDGPFQGPITHNYYENKTYELIFEGKTHRGRWKIENKRLCTKKNTASNYNCVYWYTGFKGGGQYAYIIAQGQIFQQFHETKSFTQINQEKKKAAEAKRKAAEAKRIADAKKLAQKKAAAEAKRKAAEAKRIADAKKLEQKKAEAKAKRIAEEILAKKWRPAQLKAQNYYNDLVEFFAINQTEFDVRKIVKLVNLNKALKTDPFNEVVQKNFAELKAYADSSKMFLEYHESKNDERQKVILNNLALANAKLKNIMDYLSHYVQNNITSNIAPAVLEQIEIAEDTYDVKTLSEVSKVSAQLESFIHKNNLSSKYRSFLQTLSNKNKQEKKSSTILIPDNAYASGSSWACNPGYTKTGNICEDKAAKTEAQIYYKDLKKFLDINTTEFDVRTIVKLVNLNQALLTKPWTEVIEKNFIELKDFTSSSKAFNDYHKSKNNERKQAFLQKLADENRKLKRAMDYLNHYVQNNITSNIAPAVLDQIEFAEKGLKIQDSKELAKVTAQLESFINKSKLSSKYRSFLKTLDESKSDKSKVTTNKIDATDLVNTDFIKKADKFDYIALVNLTGKAPNALLNLEGNVVFENDRALSCFYQSKNTVKNDLKYYLYDKFSNKEFLVQDRGFECNQNKLFSYDLVFFEKGTLLSESKSYVSTLTAAIAYNQLQLFKTVTKEEQKEDFAYRKFKVASITENLKIGASVGFGSMIIDNNNTTLCTDVEDTLGQKSIMNLLSNEFTRMGYGKSVSKILFNDVETTFANVQRGNCGFIYAGEQTLAKLLNAFERSGTKYDILPIWYSDQNVKNEQLRQESKEQNKLVNAQKRKEKLEQEQELAAIRAEADGVLKKKQQEELRKLHNNIVKAHIQRMEKEAKLLLDEDPKNTGEILSHYPDLVDFMKQKLKEKWELSNSSVEINDYGDGNYAGRTIETFITDIKFKLMNRNIGKYEDFCVRVAFLDDQEFARYREPEIRGECTPSNFDSYKKKLRFQSKWIVQ